MTTEHILPRQTWCEVCETDGVPLTVTAFDFAPALPFLVCADCIEAYEAEVGGDALLVVA